MKRRTFLGGTIAAAVVGRTSGVAAQQPPIKIGMSMAQTGGLAGGGKASQLGIEIWRDDVNAKGGMLGRKVELVVYDDKSSASETPAIYSKLLDVDKVDLLFAPYATVPTAPIMPLVKQRGMLLIGNFSFQVNSKVRHDMWFNNAPWGPADAGPRRSSISARRPAARPWRCSRRTRNSHRTWTVTARSPRRRALPIVYDQNYPPTTVEFSASSARCTPPSPTSCYVRPIRPIQSPSCAR